MRNNVRPDLKTAEVALRSFLAPKSIFRIREPKGADIPPLTNKSPQLLHAEMEREIRVLDKLWRRYYRAGGKKL